MEDSNRWEIYRPVRSNRLSQKFGENKACISSITGRVYTSVDGVCPLGTIRLYQDKLHMKGHNGEDWGLVTGEPVGFPVDAPDSVRWVAQTHVDRDGGIGVDVFSLDPHPILGYIKFRFWHLKKVNVHDGQSVRFGDVVGFGNSTGLSSGPHVHWNVKQTTATSTTKFGNTLNRGNGYYGAVDMRQYFDYQNIFVGDVLEDEIGELQTTLIMKLRIWLEELRKVVSNLK